MSSFILILMCSIFIWGSCRSFSRGNTQPHNNRLSKHANYFQQNAQNALKDLQEWRLTNVGRSIVQELENQSNAVNLAQSSSVCRTLALKLDALNNSSNTKNNYIGLTIHFCLNYNLIAQQLTPTACRLVVKTSHNCFEYNTRILTISIQWCLGRKRPRVLLMCWWPRLRT